MDIETLVKMEAGGDSEHDRAYADALRNVYEAYKGTTRSDLLEMQPMAREMNRERMGTHFSVAACVIIHEMLKDTGGGGYGDYELLKSMGIVGDETAEHDWAERGCW